MTEETWTARRALEWTSGYLERRGDENPRLAAEWLLSEACGLTRVQLYMDYDRPLSAEEREVLRGYVTRRGQGEPLQYIAGEAPFRYLTLKVRPGVLIPRPETEVLVSEAIACLPPAAPRAAAWNAEAAEQEAAAVAALKEQLAELAAVQGGAARTGDADGADAGRAGSADGTGSDAWYAGNAGADDPGHVAAGGSECEGGADGGRASAGGLGRVGVGDPRCAGGAAARCADAEHADAADPGCVGGGGKHAEDAGGAAGAARCADAVGPGHAGAGDAGRTGGGGSARVGGAFDPDGVPVEGVDRVAVAADSAAKATDVSRETLVREDSACGAHATSEITADANIDVDAAVAVAAGSAVQTTDVSRETSALEYSPKGNYAPDGVSDVFHGGASADDRPGASRGDAAGEAEESDSRGYFLVADVCTGSGCVACAIASERPDTRVIAVDIAPEAVALARENVRAAGVAETVRVLQGNLGDPVPERYLGRFDLVVSNPPYVPTDVLAGIPREVSDYEPTLALDGGADGLDLFRPLVAWAARALRPGGAFACELHEGHLDEAAALARAAGLEHTRVVADLAGRPRVLVARKPR